MATDKRMWVGLAVAAVVLVGCGAPDSTPGAAVTVIVPQTVVVRETVVVPQTAIVRHTVIAPQTVIVTVTPKSTSTEQETSAAAASIPKIKDSTDQVQDRGGVQIAVYGISLFDWTEAVKLDDAWTTAVKDDKAFQDAQVLGSLGVIVTNTTSSKINVYPDQGVIVIGNEQVELTGFTLYSDDVGGTFFPGVTKKGVVFFTLKNTSWAQITGGVDALYEVDEPSESESYKPLAKAPYTFAMRLK